MPVATQELCWGQRTVGLNPFTFQLSVIGQLPNVFGSYFPCVKNGDDNIYLASLTRLLSKTTKALLSVDVANNLSHNTVNRL